jgi:structural maintenance of chromosome 4
LLTLYHDRRSQSKPDAIDEKRIKVLEAEIARQTKELEKLKGKASAIEGQIKELQEKILEVGGVKLLAIQSKVNNTKSLIDMAGEKITKAEVAQAKAERDADKLEKSIAGNTTKLQDLEAELEVADADLQSCTADLETIRAKVEEAQNGLCFVQEDLAEAKTELDEKTQNINAFRALEVSLAFVCWMQCAHCHDGLQMDIKQKLEDNSRIQKESKVKFKHWQNRHQELELAHIE